MSVTLKRSSYTLTFRNGNMIASPTIREPQQVVNESEDLTIRVATISTNERKTISVFVQKLQKAVEGSYSGYDKLIGFIENTIDYSMNTCILTDADGDINAVRLVGPYPLQFDEPVKNVFDGVLEFRVEV